MRSLTKDLFAVKQSAEGNEYIEIVINEMTKKNQGRETSTSSNLLHNDHTIIAEQKGNVCCLVNSFKYYIECLNPNRNDFFNVLTNAKMALMPWSLVRKHLDL